MKLDSMTVRDLMIPLDRYAVVSEAASVGEAMRALRSIRDSFVKHQSPRAVLVRSRTGKIIGQLGHLDFLHALEPKYSLLGDLDMLARAGVSGDTVKALADHLQLWDRGLLNACHQAGRRPVTEVMHTMIESLDENLSLAEAVHSLVLWQAVRCLATRQGETVGVLRLADVFDVITDRVDSAKAEEGVDTL